MHFVNIMDKNIFDVKLYFFPPIWNKMKYEIKMF